MRRAARLRPMLARAALAALIGGVPAWADEFAERRETCEPLVTAIHDACSVLNQYVCADGSRFFERYDSDGLVAQELNDIDYGLGPMLFSRTGGGWSGIADAVRQFSFAELTFRGRSSGAYLMELRQAPGQADWVELDAEMTDDTRVLRGTAYRLARLAMTIQAPEGGTATWIGTGLIDPARSFMIADYHTISRNGVESSLGGRLITIASSGEDGFMITSAPTCEPHISSAPLPEPSHG